MSSRNIACLVTVIALGGALALPLDFSPPGQVANIASALRAPPPQSDSAYQVPTSTWLPDVYVSPPTPTTSVPGGGLYVDVDSENFLVSPSPNPNASLPTPSIVFVETPTTQLPLPEQSQATETSTVYSTVWVTAAPSSAFVTSTVSPTPTTSVGSPSSASTPSGTSKTRAILAAYYPDWSSDDLLPEQVDFGRFDWVDFAFAVPTSAFDLAFTADDSVSLLQRLVKLAHSSTPPKRVKLSIGGWDGSKYFSQAVSTPSNTATFVKNIKSAVSTYGVDGVDIDWEYPGAQGAGGNIVSPSDTVNFLSFLQQLRSALGPSAFITAAVSTSPFYLPASNSSSATNIFNSFGKVLDYITIMNYDVHDNTSPSPGSNAPLLSHGPSCPSAQDVVSAELSIDQWAKAGFPVGKILLGVPSYGYAITSTATALTETPDRRRNRAFSMRRHWSMRRRRSPRYQRRQDQLGNSSDTNVVPSPVPPASSASSDINLAATPPSSSDASRPANVVTDSSGQVQFRYLVQVGALVKNTTTDGPSSAAPPSFIGSGSYTRHWDQCSSTPYLVSQSQKKVISYDDPESLQLKARYAIQRGAAGVNMFDVHGDMLDWVLTDSLRAGLEQPGPPITN